MGWTGSAELQPCDEDGAELPAENNSGSQNSAQIIPVPACGIMWHIPDKRRSSLGGLCRSRGSCTPSWVFCSAELYIPCKMGNMSLRDTDRTASFVSLLAYVKQLSVEVFVIASVKKGAVMPIKAEGHPRCIFFHLEGQQVSCCMAITKPLCCAQTAVQKQEFQAVRAAFRPDPVPLCSNRILHCKKKERYYAKIPIGSTCTDKKALLQHAEMLLWALKPQEQVPFISQKEGIKTAEQ